MPQRNTSREPSTGRQKALPSLLVSQIDIAGLFHRSRRHARLIPRHHTDNPNTTTTKRKPGRAALMLDIVARTLTEPRTRVRRLRLSARPTWHLIATDRHFNAPSYKRDPASPRRHHRSSRVRIGTRASPQPVKFEQSRASHPRFPRAARAPYRRGYGTCHWS